MEIRDKFQQIRQFLGSRRFLQIGRKKVLLLGSAALLVVAVVGGGAFLLLPGGDQLTYESQSAMRKALPAKAAAELDRRGVRLAAPLECEDLPGHAEERLRVSCTGTTAEKKPVDVVGSGQQETAETYYTILVSGQPIVENAPCLGDDCGTDDD